MSVITDTDTITVTSAVVAPPCEHSQHRMFHPDEPAAWHVLVICPGCSDMADYLLCDWGRKWLTRPGSLVGCEVCSTVSRFEDFVLMCVRLEVGK